MSTVADTLAHYGALTDEVIREYIPLTEPRAALYDLVREYPGRPGKAIRPSLCLAMCAALAGDLDDALPTAAAIELLHNAFLVHDDIEDGTARRRGGDALHVRHGLPLAVHAGDALLHLAHAPLRANHERLGNRMATAVAVEFDRMTRHTLEGQAVELGWRRDKVVDLTPDDYLDVIMRKTCWYTTIHPLRAGALIGSWGRFDLDALVRFGFYLGAAFQIQDDLLDLVADGDYGKERWGDLYEGKRTLMVIHLASHARGADRRTVQEFLVLEREERTPAAVEDIREMMDRHGSIAFARAFGHGIASAAHDAFDIAFESVPESRDREFLHDLIDYMLERPT
jgi:geranylgeranyl diphosphate synthase type II